VCIQRWPVSHKERTVGALSRAPLQVLHDGLPGSGRDRQHINALTFGAPQPYRAVSPIEILEFKPRHFSCAQPERLYLPREWADDRARRKKAHVPASVRFKTKPQIALEQIRAALLASVPPGVVLIDASYGNNSKLRQDGIGAQLRSRHSVNHQSAPCARGRSEAAARQRRRIGAQPAQARLARRHVAGRHQREAAVALCPCAGARCADPGRSTF
jgi:hypothetical protein